MTASKLLKPRFLVIADYPDSPFKIGDIITWDSVIWGCNKIIMELKNFFSCYRCNLSLQQLRDIKNIIWSKNEN